MDIFQILLLVVCVISLIVFITDVVKTNFLSYPLRVIDCELLPENKYDIFDNYYIKLSSPSLKYPLEIVYLSTRINRKESELPCECHKFYCYTTGKEITDRHLISKIDNALDRSAKEEEAIRRRNKWHDMDKINNLRKRFE